MEFYFVILYVGARNVCSFLKAKNMKKLFAICLCLTLFFNMGATAFASEGRVIQPRYTFIANYGLSLNINDGTAHISADLDGKTGTTEAYIKCNLEKLMGSYWMQMKSFEEYGTDTVWLSAYHKVDRGTYRVMGTFRCNNETQTAYSGNFVY